MRSKEECTCIKYGRCIFYDKKVLTKPYGSDNYITDNLIIGVGLRKEQYVGTRYEYRS